MNQSGKLRCLPAWFGLLCALAADAVAGDWPAFRGPDGNGVAQEKQAPLHWARGLNVRWKAPLPGPGNSSPIVSRGRVFVTFAESAGKKRNLYCFNRQNGAQLWVRTVGFPVVEPTHQSNPYCAPTPVADGTRVVVWHGSAGVFCYNFAGKELWKADLGEVRNEWGYGSSPILHRGKIILNFGPGERAFLCALDLKTGKLLWKYDEPGGPSTVAKGNIGTWCTPIVAKVGGKDQILCSMLTQVVACDPKTGARLWFCEGLAEEKADLIYPSPVVCGEVGVAFTGWVNGPTIGFKLGGSGNTTSNRLWLEKQPQRIGSGVVVGTNVFIVNAGPGTAQCIECQTGTVRWTERLNGGESWGSVVVAVGRCYVTSRRGVTTVFRANPEKFELLAANDLGEPSNATPAISDGQIFLRTDAYLYCIAEDRYLQGDDGHAR